MSLPCPILGFIVSVRVADQTPPAEAARLFEELTALLDRHGLTASVRPRAGGTAPAREYQIRREGSQATDADRSLVREWASRWNGRATVIAGDIVDLGEP